VPPPVAPPQPRRPSLRFDWSALGSLRLRARAIADGVYAGAHPSVRKGSGVEFGGHRAYVPGDDLRLLDRRASLRHDKLLVRELETETDRGLRLLVDASASMGYQGEKAPVSKLAYASAVVAALARVGLASGDPFSLSVLGGRGGGPLGAASGREAFERLLAALESTAAYGALDDDLASLDRALAAVARGARRGAIVVFASDLVDAHPAALARFAALGSQGRTLVALRVLDPDEATLPFDGPLRLRAMEGTHEVETDAPAVRDAYLDAMNAIARTWRVRLEATGGGLVEAVTTDDPVAVVRAIARLAARGGA
jgi:uncharacterized protein (DUF58 family)